MMNKIWDKFAKDYEKKVLSLTKVPQRRKQILAEIKKGKILNLGTGPTSYLNQDLIKNGNIVVATDISQKMLNVVKNQFIHPNLEYKCADNKNLPFDDESFDTVISVNSILPEKREDAVVMVKEIFRVLKKGGKFIALLPSFDNFLPSPEKKISGTHLKLDFEQLRVWDTNQWQCFYTEKTIERMMANVGFKKYKIKKVFLKTKEEIEQIKRIYGKDTSKSPVHEYFLIAEKLLGKK